MSESPNIHPRDNVRTFLADVGVQQTVYYSAWCSVCGVISFAGYDRKQAEKVVEMHKDNYQSDAAHAVITDDGAM